MIFVNETVVDKIKKLANAVIEEAKQNKEFSWKLEQILIGETSIAEENTSKKTSETTRPANRRDPAVLDPISLITEGEEVLAERLHELTDKQLKDIIADYGMDPAKLAMKWKNRERLINHIIDVSQRRASKGDAFRK